MKKTILISILLAFSAMSFAPSDTDGLLINTGISSGNSGFWFSINGEISDDYLGVILTKFPDAKREKKMFKWKFNNVVIPGVDKSVNFQIHQGVHYVRNENGNSGFNTFSTKTEKLLKEREEQSDKIEKGLIIYIYKNKLGRKDAIKTESEEEIVKKYLYSIFEN